MARVYFAAPMRGDRRALGEVRELMRHIEARGHVILTKHVADDMLDTDRGLSHEEVFKRDIELLEQADILVAEVSYPSLGVGFELAYALVKGKPVAALVKRDRLEALSSLIRGITWSNFSLIVYDSAGDAIARLSERGLL